MDRRLRTALLTAPLVAILVAWAGVYLMARLTLEEPIPEGAAAHTLFFFILLGIPFASLVALLVGMPVVHWLERTGRLRLLPLMLSGSIVGAVGVSATWDVLWGSPAVALPIVAIGGSAGALAALVFWMIGAPQRRSQPHA